MPVSDFTLQDRGIRENVDYHTMTWDKREIDFDDLKSPAGHVVTGVKFRLLGRHLNMEMRVTEIDFASGRLIEPDKSFWVSNDNTDISNGQARRTELALVGLLEIECRSSLNQTCFFAEITRHSNTVEIKICSYINDKQLHQVHLF